MTLLQRLEAAEGAAMPKFKVVRRWGLWGVKAKWTRSGPFAHHQWFPRYVWHGPFGNSNWRWNYPSGAQAFARVCRQQCIAAIKSRSE